MRLTALFCGLETVSGLQSKSVKRPSQIKKCGMINVGLVHNSLLGLTSNEMNWKTKSNLHAGFSVSLVWLENL